MTKTRDEQAALNFVKRALEQSSRLVAMNAGGLRSTGEATSALVKGVTQAIRR